MKFNFYNTNFYPAKAENFDRFWSLVVSAVSYIHFTSYSRFISLSHSILYQRGVYPADTFKREVCYGLPMVLTDNKDLQEYIENVLKQVQGMF